MWIFGYGSLIWKPGFRWVEKKVGFIKGFERRFYQGSYDHRGVPGNPGRVVTLLPDEQAVTWGVAFKIINDEAQRVLKELDHREKGGYRRHRVPVYRPTATGVATTAVDRALVYLATEDNPHYLGPATAQEIARQVKEARGPSGPNTEYVLRLAESLRQFDVHDPHVFSVAAALRYLMAREE